MTNDRTVHAAAPVCQRAREPVLAYLLPGGGTALRFVPPEGLGRLSITWPRRVLCCMIPTLRCAARTTRALALPDLHLVDGSSSGRTPHTHGRFQSMRPDAASCVCMNVDE
jgi:hypothetical protein